MQGMLGRAWIAGCVVVLCACGGSNSTLPTTPSTPDSSSLRTTVGGLLIESASRPVGGATLRVVSPPADEGIETTSDESGSFRLTGIQSTTFTIRIVHPRYLTLEREYTFQPGAVTTNLSVTLARIPGSGEFRFVVQDGVDAAELPPVREAIDRAREYLQRTFQWRPTLDVEVLLSTLPNIGSSTATASATRITVYIQSEGWKSARQTRRKILLHELFHVLQQQEGWNMGLTWLVEGSAEIVGFRGTWVEERLLTEVQVRGCHIWSVTGSSVLMPLENYATNNGQPFPPNGGPIYSLFFLAADRLVSERGIGSLKRVTNVESDFGLSLPDYYSQFAAYRATLSRPARYECPQ